MFEFFVPCLNFQEETLVGRIWLVGYALETPVLYSKLQLCLTSVLDQKFALSFCLSGI